MFISIVEVCHEKKTRELGENLELQALMKLEISNFIKS
jgi:hypothetical protein